MKNQTTNDVLSLHRVPLELMSIRREGIAASNDLNKVDWMFHKNELMPLAHSLMELNEFASTSIISLKSYTGLEEVVSS